jgi:threonine synthase
MLCVQSEACAPLVRAIESGALDTVAVPGPGTIAFGLNVPAGVGHFRVLEIVRASGGACVAVSEAELAAELGREWRRTHGWLSPEGAACLAALPQLLERGLLERGHRAVVVNTGSSEKYLPALRQLLD